MHEEILEIKVQAAGDVSCSILYELTYYGFGRLFLRSIGVSTPPPNTLPPNMVQFYDEEKEEKKEKSPAAVDSDVGYSPQRAPPRAIPKRRYSF